jgi:hypothetical protein
MAGPFVCLSPISLQLLLDYFVVEQGCQVPVFASRRAKVYGERMYGPFAIPIGQNCYFSARCGCGHSLCRQAQPPQLVWTFHLSTRITNELNHVASSDSGKILCAGEMNRSYGGLFLGAPHT